MKQIYRLPGKLQIKVFSSGIIIFSKVTLNIDYSKRHSFRSIEKLIDDLQKDDNSLQDRFHDNFKDEKQLERQFLEMDLFGSTLAQVMTEIERNSSDCSIDELPINQPRQWLHAGDKGLLNAFNTLKEGKKIEINL